MFLYFLFCMQFSFNPLRDFSTNKILWYYVDLFMKGRYSYMFYTLRSPVMDFHEENVHYKISAIRYLKKVALVEDWKLHFLLEPFAVIRLYW